MDEREKNQETKENQHPPEEKKSEHTSLHHSLLGPSLLKAGQEDVDQKKVAEIIYEASVGSKFFKHEEKRDEQLTEKINAILARKAHLETLDLYSDTRKADEVLALHEAQRDLTQYIVHVDCDAFYASVEELERPELKLVPMAVGKGVITTCNYKAREWGVRSGMAGHIAQKLCPKLVFVPLNFEKYTAKAMEIRKVLAKYDERYEAASCDEAYMNITAYCEMNNIDPDEAVQILRAEVHEKTHLTISAGIAPNTRLAKIASNQNKPNGQFRIMNDRASVMSFMASLPVRKVNGVGRVFERELESVGIKVCGDIYHMRGMLAQLFGEKANEFLLGCYLGIGRTRVQPAGEYERKSIGTERTFKDLYGSEKLRERMKLTAEDLDKDLKETQVSGRTLVLKIKLHNYQVHSRQKSLPYPIQNADDIYKFALPLLAAFERQFGNALKIRLMGLRLTNLVDQKKPIRNIFEMGGDETARPMLGKRKSSDNNPANHSGDDDGWEVWPEEEFSSVDREIAPLPLGEESIRESALVTDTSELEPTQEPAKWPCPVCARPVVANDKDFNAHVDFCLSKSVIREAVQEASESESPTTLKAAPLPPVTKKARVGSRPSSSRGTSGSGSAGEKKQKFFWR